MHPPLPNLVDHRDYQLLVNSYTSIYYGDIGLAPHLRAVHPYEPYELAFLSFELCPICHGRREHHGHCSNGDQIFQAIHLHRLDLQSVGDCDWTGHGIVKDDDGASDGALAHHHVRHRHSMHGSPRLAPRPLLPSNPNQEQVVPPGSNWPLLCILRTTILALRWAWSWISLRLWMPQVP